MADGDAYVALSKVDIKQKGVRVHCCIRSLSDATASPKVEINPCFNSSAIRKKACDTVVTSKAPLPSFLTPILRLWLVILCRLFL